MKGLLLKDAYMTCKYCRSYLLVIAVFLFVGPFCGDNLFPLIYPCIMVSMLPVNLMTYDANSKWEQYAGTLPCSRAQLVSAKYLMGLFASCGVLVLNCLVQALLMVGSGGFRGREFGVMAAMMLISSCLAPAITLPLVFRFGTEKGRILYLVVVGVICGVSAILGVTGSSALLSQEISLPVVSLVCLAAVALYAGSWWLSIRFYRKREL